MKVIAVDTGNKQIKTENLTFMSGIISDTNASLASADDVFRVNGKVYSLARERQPYLRDKTINDRYFNLVMLAIAKELELDEFHNKTEHKKDEIHDIHFILGLPPVHMKDSGLKNRFSSYFKTNDIVKVVYKNKTWNILIKKVTIYAQCFAALMTRYDEIKDEPRVLGIDIGGFTADYLSVRKGRIDVSTSDSLESGIITLYQRIKKAALAKDYIIEEEDIDDVLKNIPNKLDPVIIKIVNSETTRFVDDFLSSFREYQIDLRNQLIIFMGGAALTLRPFLEAHPLIKNCEFLEDINANAAGYKKLWQITGRK